MELYIVNFKFHDRYEKRINDITWTLACKNDDEVAQIMTKHFKELKRCGYEGLGYSFTKIKETDNGFKVLVHK